MAPIRRSHFSFYLIAFGHLVNHHLPSHLGPYFAMSSVSYMPLQKHEVQSFDHNSVPPPTAPDNPSSSCDEQANNLGIANSIKSEQPHRDPVHTTRKAPQAPRGMILMKSLLLPLVGEDIHLERPSTSDAVLQPSRILLFATPCIIGWSRLLQITSSLAIRRRRT